MIGWVVGLLYWTKNRGFKQSFTGPSGLCSGYERCPLANCNLHFSHQSQWIKACTKCGSYAILALGVQIPLYYHHTAVRLLFFIFIFYFLINEWQDDNRAGYAITIPIPFHFHLHWVISSPPLTKRSIRRLTYVYIQFFGNWI